ncbi:MAG TPA: hypothetical protein HA349_05270 [Methanotrichaceae archaeon]|nr:hypothetical protein [Methanotrichaceae archaeon]
MGKNQKNAPVRPSLAEDLLDEEAVALVEKVISYYKANAEKQRLGEFIDEIGFEKFKKAVL